MQNRLAQISENLIEACWLTAVALIPLYFNIYSSRIFEPDKISIFRSLAVVIMAAWVPISILNLKKIRNLRTPEKQIWIGFLKKPFVLPVGLMLVAYTLATIFSVHPGISWLGSYQRVQGTLTLFSYLVIFLAILLHLRRKDQFHRLVNLVILVSVPVALYGILQHYKLDPIPWGKDTSIRVASTLGNSIFIAAYLIMVFPLAVGRFMFASREIISGRNVRMQNWLRIFIYGFICLVQIAAIYFSGSRGPVLGLLAGTLLALFLLSFVWGLRKIKLLLVFGLIFGGGFLILFNTAGGPFETLRKAPVLGRFGRMLDTESNTAKVRAYIWEGAVDLVLPHAPIEYPDGTKDRYNFMRPILGYGPESMFEVYNPFYPTKLGQVERRNASPDRSHNETWDTLIITGLLGMVAYLGIILSIFYYGISWLGLISERRDIGLFWLSVALCGMLSTILLVFWGGLAYFGVALPFGMALGILLYLAIASIKSYFKKYPELTGQPVPARQMTQEGKFYTAIMLSILLSHFLEINFGIAVISTRMLFWIFTGLLLVIRYRDPWKINHEESENKPVGETFAVRRPMIRRPKEPGNRGRRRGTRDHNREVDISWLYSSAVYGALISICLVALTFNFIVNPERLTSISQLISTSLLYLGPEAKRFSPGILGLFVVTWLGGAFFLTLESTDSVSQGSSWKRKAVTGLIAIVLSLPFILVHARALTTIASFRIVNIESLFEQSFRVTNLVNLFYGYLVILILFLSYCLYVQSPLHTITENKMPILWLSAAMSVVVGIFFIYTVNIKPVYADILFKLAEPFSSASRWDIVDLLYQQSVDYSPTQDYYYLFLGKASQEQAKTAVSPDVQEKYAQQALQNLNQAQRLNPLNVDHTANLARLYSWWASVADAGEKIPLAEKADTYYSRSVVLRPNYPDLWAEWSTLYLDVLPQPERSLELLQHALDLDGQYNITQGFAGNFYMNLAQSSTNLFDKEQAYEKAKGYYLKAVDLSTGDSKTKYLIALSNVYISQSQRSQEDSQKISYDPEYLKSALQILLDAEEFVSDQNDTVSLKTQIAKVYHVLGDPVKALEYIDAALLLATDVQKPYIEQIRQEIASQP